MTKLQKPLITIIVPVKNEEKNIESAITSIQTYVTSPHETIIVYDSPDDTTVPTAQKLLRQDSSLSLVQNAFGFGIINAVKTGIKKAQGEAIVIMSPDLADHPKTIQEMYKRLTQGYDIVGATRYAKGGKRLDQSSLKSFLSYLAGKSTPLFLRIPITDLTNGFKMYRMSVLKNIPIESKGGWEFAMELVIKAKRSNYKITEVPTISRKRVHGSSKFRFFHWLPRYIYWYGYGLIQR